MAGNFRDSLGLQLFEEGNLTEAQPLLYKALQDRRSFLGSTHPDTLTAMNNYASLLKAPGKLSEAGPLLLEAL